MNGAPMIGPPATRRVNGPPASRLAVIKTLVRRALDERYVAAGRAGK